MTHAADEARRRGGARPGRGPERGEADDIDQDGIPAEADIDDFDELVGRARPEILCDGLDQDGDLADRCEVDVDGDGAAGESDCDDLDPEVGPDAREVRCRGQDENCRRRRRMRSRGGAAWHGPLEPRFVCFRTRGLTDSRGSLGGTRGAPSGSMWSTFWTVSALASSAGLGVLVARVSLGLVLRVVDAAAGRSGKRGA